MKELAKTKQALVLSPQFKTVLKEMDASPDPMYITGRAGTGKSTLLRLFRKTTDARVVVVAPTGIAALNVQGQTIHSFFGFPPKLLHPSDLSVRRNYRLYRKIDILVIDEISMVRADMMDNIDRFLRINRGNPYEPFGGVKLICFGDLFQLPPVIGTQEEREYLRTHYDTPYFFSANVFKDNYDLIIHELRQVFRQTDRSFINILDNVRTQSIDYDDINDLNGQVIDEEFDDSFYITMCARNAQVQKINREKLAEVNTEEFEYLARVSGDFSERVFPTDLNLKLRVGAQVMFIKNDPDKNFVNGTIGKVVELDMDKVVVQIVDSMGMIKSITVERFTWEIIKYKTDPKNEKLLKSDVIGSFNQYPLKLSWAITIHKSQGKTFDRAIIDLGKGAFESGQAYVALSRIRTLDGVALRNPLTPRDIFVDPRISEFHLNNR